MGRRCGFSDAYMALRYLALRRCVRMKDVYMSLGIHTAKRAIGQTPLTRVQLIWRVEGRHVRCAEYVMPGAAPMP